MTSANLTTDLSGKFALVTGGASGIGLATAELLAKCGATVAINHLPDDPRAKTEIERLTAAGSSVISAPGNVSTEDGCNDMVADAIKNLGGLDILINNAGTAATQEPIPFENLDAMTSEFWESIMSTNLLGPFRCSKAGAAALKAKAALINLTRNLARALSPDVRVNAVAPGFVRSPWTETWPAERRDKLINAALLKRCVETDDIAQTMLFLSAHPAVTAQTVTVDCGINL